MTQAELMTFCSRVMGSDALAQQWMSRPAMALNYRHPGDLMDTAEGREKIEVLLTQIEGGVYI